MVSRCPVLRFQSPPKIQLITVVSKDIWLSTAQMCPVSCILLSYTTEVIGVLNDYEMQMKIPLFWATKNVYVQVLCQEMLFSPQNAPNAFSCLAPRADPLEELIALARITGRNMAGRGQKQKEAAKEGIGSEFEPHCEIANADELGTTLQEPVLGAKKGTPAGQALYTMNFADKKSNLLLLPLILI